MRRTQTNAACVNKCENMIIRALYASEQRLQSHGEAYIHIHTLGVSYEKTQMWHNERERNAVVEKFEKSLCHRLCIRLCVRLLAVLVMNAIRQNVRQQKFEYKSETNKMEECFCMARHKQHTSRSTFNQIIKSKLFYAHDAHVHSFIDAFIHNFECF